MIKKSLINKNNFSQWNEEMAERYDPEFYHESSSYPIRIFEKMRVMSVIKLMRCQKENYVLEVGCGAGNILKKLKVGRIFGVDISERMIRKCYQKLAGRGTVIKAFGERLPFRDGTFDRVICSEVIEHVLEPREIIKEISRVMKEDAIAVISIPHEKMLSKVKMLILKLRLGRFLATDSYRAPVDMTDEWHLHNFDYPLLEEFLNSSLEILKRRTLPFSFLPMRYVVECKKKNRNKIKTLHVIDHLGAGGAQQIIEDIVRLSDRDHFDYTILYFFDRHNFKQELIDLRCRVIFFGLGKYNHFNLFLNLLNPLIYVRIIRFLTKNKFNIVHLHLYYTYLIMLPWIGLINKFSKKKIKVIYTMHAMKNQIPFFFFLMPLLSLFVNLFVAEVEESVEELLNIGIPCGRIRCIHIATNFFKLNPADPMIIRREFGILKDAPLILNIGRLHRQKGHRYLIAAFREVLDNCPEARLVIVGDGEDYKYLMQLTKELAIEKKVFLVGYRRDLLNFYDACDIFVVPSVNEALGIAVMEAMARNKPIIAFDVGALERLVRSGQTGFLVSVRDVKELASKILVCINDRKLRLKMGNLAKEIVKSNYSLDIFVGKYYNLYRSLYYEKATEA